MARHALTSGVDGRDADQVDRLALSTRTLLAHREPISGAQVRGLTDATAASGFTDVSMWSQHYYWATADDMTRAAFIDYHRGRGLGIPVMEVALDWTSGDRESIATASAPVLEVAELVGARTVIAATMAPQLPRLAEAAVGMRHLCRLAADRGLRVSLEFLPFSAVPTLRSAIDLVEATGVDNLGLVLDTWHWFRQPGGPDLASLRTLPPERIDVLQLNDAPAQPQADLVAECRGHRLLPGTGAIDILGVLEPLAAIGAAPILVAEVFSHSLAALGPRVMAQRVFDATAALLGRVDLP